MTVEEWLGADNQLGIDIWNRKYRHNDESFDEWLDRVCAGNDAIKRLIIEKKFLFGGRILSNRGVDDVKTTLSNCYVITPPEDNLESIYDCRKKLARTYSYGGGCGIDISKLSPAGATVRNQARKTSGAVSFMQGFSQTTEEIGQNGRRGALMISLDCHHPDLPEFIDIKTKDGSVTKANISVRVTDDFMKAVEDDGIWHMEFTRPETGETICRDMPAKMLFEKLCENNWNWAEPGILFWDRISGYNLLANTPEFEYSGVNPCAEEPLPAGGSCLLASMNLASYVENNEFQFIEFASDVELAVHAMNDVLEEGLPMHPLDEQKESVFHWKQIGLGVMGIADMLIKLDLRYDSDEAIDLCDDIGVVMANAAIAQSEMESADRGNYKDFDAIEVGSTEFFKNNASVNTSSLLYTDGLCNSQLLTIAPTGTISTMLGVSGGIEPIFANSYNRKTESLHNKEVTYKVYTPIVDRYMKEHNLTDESQLPDYFVTSATIDPMKRIKMQGVWQKHIDASISSTVNLPNSATIEDVERLYMYAWKCGLKGLTIYREGCKREGVLTTGKSTSYEPASLPRGAWKPKPADTLYHEVKLKTGCGKMVLMIGWSESEQAIQDIYVKKCSKGGCERLLESATIAMSAVFRLGGKTCNLEKAMEGIGTCNSFTAARKDGKPLSNGSSCGEAILRALREFEQKQSACCSAEKGAAPEHPAPKLPAEAHCPECGEPIRYEGGCKVCKNCGWNGCD